MHGDASDDYMDGDDFVDLPRRSVRGGAAVLIAQGMVFILGLGSAALLARIDAKLAVGGGPDRWLGERAREKAAAEVAAAEAAARAAEEEAARAAAQAAAPTPEVT